MTSRWTALFAACMAFSGLSAQEFRATITGHITDQSGAAVPSVVVQVKNTNTNAQLGLETYDYDTISRLHTVTREDNKQDSFTYYLDGELNVATYGAAATPPPTPTHFSRAALFGARC